MTRRRQTRRVRDAILALDRAVGQKCAWDGVVVHLGNATEENWRAVADQPGATIDARLHMYVLVGPIVHVVARARVGRTTVLAGYSRPATIVEAARLGSATNDVTDLQPN